MSPKQAPKAKPKDKAKVAAPALPPKTFADVPYGSHPRQVIDFWKADTKCRFRISAICALSKLSCSMT